MHEEYRFQAQQIAWNLYSDIWNKKCDYTDD